jgi:hypothetical protein
MITYALAVARSPLRQVVHWSSPVVLRSEPPVDPAGLQPRTRPRPSQYIGHARQNEMLLRACTVAAFSGAARGQSPQQIPTAAPSTSARERVTAKITS